MEAALRGMLESTFGEFVEGLDRANAASFPMTLKDLRLKEKRIQEELDEEGNFPFDLSDGRIGNITVTPGWMGTVEVVATNVVLNFSFSPMKAMNKAMRKDSDDEEEQFESVPRAAQASPPADVAPRFCQRHFTSAQREKIDPLMRPCQKCGTQITSTYASMTLCPPCSNTEESCMICGDHAPVASNYVPPKTLNPQSGPSGPPGGAVYAMPDPGAKRGSTLPPPPPPSASHSPSRRMSDDWRMGLGSPNSQPPPPPPPPARGRTGVSHSDHREHRARDTARPAPREKGFNPPILPQAELSAAEAGGRAKNGGHLQAMYSSATSQLDGLFEYLSSSLPALDMNAWTTCLNSGDQRSDLKEFGMSPKTRRRPVVRV